MNKGIKIDRDGTIWKDDIYKGRIMRNCVSRIAGTFNKYVADIDKGRYMKTICSDSYRLLCQDIRKELV